MTARQEDAIHTNYEWTFETYEDNDPEKDITESVFDDTLKRLRFQVRGEEGRFGLMVQKWSHTEGETYRDYAYVENDALPETFPEGHRILDKHRKEWASTAQTEASLKAAASR